MLPIDVGRTVATVSTATTVPTVRRPTTATARLAVTEALASRWKTATRAAATSSSRAATVGTRLRATGTASAATTTESASNGRCRARRGNCRLERQQPLPPTTRTWSSIVNVSLATLALAVRILTRVPAETLALTAERVR